jgi:hypothetical protein
MVANDARVVVLNQVMSFHRVGTCCTLEFCPLKPDWSSPRISKSFIGGNSQPFLSVNARR